MLSLKFSCGQLGKYIENCLFASIIEMTFTRLPTWSPFFKSSFFCHFENPSIIFFSLPHTRMQIKQPQKHDFNVNENNSSHKHHHDQSVNHVLFAAIELEVSFQISSKFLAGLLILTSAFPSFPRSKNWRHLPIGKFLRRSPTRVTIQIRATFSAIAFLNAGG